MSCDISNVILCAQDLQLIEQVLSENTIHHGLNLNDAMVEDRQRYLISRFASGPQTKEQLVTALSVYDALNTAPEIIEEPRTTWPDEHHATSLMLASRD